MTDANGVDPGVFRAAIGHFMSGVVVLTTVDGGERHGMTVSAITSLSLDPPMLLACLNSRSQTQQAIHRSGVFAVHILTEDQGDLAARFARPAQGDQDRFAGLDTHPGTTGAPLISDVLAVIECRVAQEVTGGSHRIFLADALTASTRNAAPLAYFRGGFGRIELAKDNEAYDRLRTRLLSRSVEPGATLNVSEVAESLNLPDFSVVYALTRLVDDGLVTRDSEVGFTVTPLDARASDDAHDAVLAIELGVAELTGGRLRNEQLAELRRLAHDTMRYANGGETDIDAYISANRDFHNYLVSCAGIRTLDDAYRRMSIPDLMNRALTGSASLSPELAQEHLELTQAFARADLVAVKELLIRHSERAKAVQRAGIELAGGRI
jgi:flavin reductase (DIM6/NTAB) family NADH-FMN oxidoreductase RutF/DNA-binding GntR family transcriptional regulator